jgi:nucleotide-binding universal stress UspA family protein
MSLPRSILCPVDFSEPAEHALRYALTLAEGLGIDAIQLVHVYQTPAHLFPVGSDYVLQAEPEVKRSLHKELEDLARRYGAHGVSIATKWVEGTPHEAIVAAAKELGADLIVMGTHGRGAVQHLLLGSVAERVVRTSHVPVCTVRVPPKS